MANPSDCVVKWGCDGTNYQYYGDGSAPTFLTFSNDCIDDDKDCRSGTYNYAQTVELKVYTTTPDNKDINFFLVARALGNNLACRNRLWAHYYDGLNDRDKTDVSIDTNGCQRAYTFPAPFPVRYFHEIIDNGVPTGVYMGRLVLEYGPRNIADSQSSIKLGPGTDLRFGYYGDNNTNLPPSNGAQHSWANVYPTNFSRENRLRFYFRPGCSVAAGTPINLLWDDINEGNASIQPDDATATLYKFRPGTQDLTTWQTWVGFGRIGPNPIGYDPVVRTFNNLGSHYNPQWNAAVTENYSTGQPYAYLMQFDNIDGGNGISFKFPFDSATAATACPPPSAVRISDLTCTHIRIDDPTGTDYYLIVKGSDGTTVDSRAFGAGGRLTDTKDWDTYVQFNFLRPHITYTFAVYQWGTSNLYSRVDLDQCMRASCTGMSTTPPAAVEPGERVSINYGIQIQNLTNVGFGNSYTSQLTTSPGLSGSGTGSGNFASNSSIDLDGPFNATADYTGNAHAELLYGAANITSLFGSISGTNACDKAYTPYTRPYINIERGDVSAGGGFAYKHADGSISCPTATEAAHFFAPTSQTRLPGTTSDENAGGIRTFASSAAYNSTADYAAYALGLIDGASNSASKYGFFSDNMNATYNGFTFANTDSVPAAIGSNLGGRMDGGDPTAHCAPDYFDTTKTRTVTDSDYTSTDNFRLDPGVRTGQYYLQQDSGVSYVEIGRIANNKVGRGASITIYVKGNVYITKDITYQNWSFDNTTKTNDSPYFALIVQGNIYVASNVTRLDGLYIAQPNDSGVGGGFSTCSTQVGTTVRSATKAEVSDSCQSVFSVHGSVIANHVYNLRSKYSLVDAAILPGIQAAEFYDFIPSIVIGTPNLNSSTDLEGVNNRPPVF